MLEDIVVLGAGGFGRETLDVISAINSAGNAPRWRVAGVVDDAPDAIQLSRLRERGAVYLGTTEEVRAQITPVTFVVGIGSPEVRARLAQKFEAAGWTSAVLVHPTAVVGSRASIAPGSVVCGGVQLSTNTTIGRHVHLNPGCIVGHDSVLGDFTSVNPGAIVSGEVLIEPMVLVGAGAVVLQGLHVQEGAIVGARACVTQNVASRTTVVGIPARELRGYTNSTSGGESVE